MRLRLLVPMVTVLLAAPAYADCADDVCGSLQKILAARSGNFAKLKGKAAVDPRGDPVWQGTQPIAGLINACYIYKREALATNIAAIPPASERSHRNRQKR